MKENAIIEGFVEARDPIRMAGLVRADLVFEKMTKLRWIPLTERMPTKEDGIDDICGDTWVLFNYHGDEFKQKGFALRYWNLFHDSKDVDGWSFLPMNWLPEFDVSLINPILSSTPPNEEDISWAKEAIKKHQDPEWRGE